MPIVKLTQRGAAPPHRGRSLLSAIVLIVLDSCNLKSMIQNEQPAMKIPVRRRYRERPATRLYVGHTSTISHAVRWPLRYQRQTKNCNYY